MLPPGDLIFTPQSNKEAGSVFSLFKPPLLRLSIVIWILWFTNNLVYYGLLLLTPQYLEVAPNNPNSIYFDTFIAALAEFPGLIIAGISVNYIGRKRTQTILLAITGIFTALLSIRGSIVMSTISAIVSRMCMIGAFSSIWIYTPEAYPTTIRTTAMGVAASIAKIAAVITPYVGYTLLDVSVYLPVGIYGAFALVASVASMFLPFETAGKPLPDVAEDTENLAHQTKPSQRSDDARPLLDTGDDNATA